MTYGRIDFYIELKKLKPVFDQIIDIVFIYVVNSIKSLKSKTSFWRSNSDRNFVFSFKTDFQLRQFLRRNLI